MEHIGEILKRVQTNTPDKNTGTSSSSEEIPAEEVCPVCHGAKFVHPMLPSGKPDYSQVVPCRCTRRETDEDRKFHLQRYSNLGSRTGMTFENIEPRGTGENPAGQEQFSRAYQAAVEFAEEPAGWLVFSGPSGCGKTHLAAAIANRCIERNHPVFYISAPDLLDHLRSSFSPDSETPYDELFEQVRNAPLLVLDDLGVQSGTSWAKEKLDQLLNHRFSNHLPTVIVSIIPVDDQDERVRTRLISAGVYELCAFDEKYPGAATYKWAPEFALQKEMTFDTFKKRNNLPLEEQENLNGVFSLALEFAKSPEGWLILQGDSGCGKTHLAAAIINYRYSIGQPALFIVVPDFLDHLRSSFSPDSKISYDKYFESVKNAPLLVLDDFGKQTTTPWAQEKLFQIINYRYNAKLPTVITTNCSTDELDGPILSRFAHPKLSTFYNITAPDFWAGRQSQRGQAGDGRRRR